MAAPRGRQQRGRSTDIPSDKSIRAGLMLHPGEDVREAYEVLVAETGVSGAEVIREALLEKLERHRKAQAKRAKSIANMQEAG
ncbi:hypothetical protein ACWCQL_34035 [Streptomyces sp. NPDC002073]